MLGIFASQKSSMYLWSLIVKGYGVTIANKKETCHNKYRIYGAKHQDEHKCAEMCDETPGCKFFFINLETWCALYNACHETRTPLYIGTTYQKTKGKISNFMPY